MLKESLGLNVDDIVKILTVGFSGISFLLSLMAFNMFKNEPQPDVADSNKLVAYKERLKNMRLYLAFTLVTLIITLAAQYVLERRLNKLTITLQEAASFPDLSVGPITLFQTDMQAPVPIPGASVPTDRAILLVRDRDQVDLNLTSLTRTITRYKAMAATQNQQLAQKTSEVGHGDR